MCRYCLAVTQKTVRPKTTAMLLVEARLGRPIEVVIREIYDAGGFQRDVAEALGVDGSTVSRWMEILQIEARPKGNGSLAALES